MVKMKKLHQRTVSLIYRKMRPPGNMGLCAFVSRKLVSNAFVAENS
jgi:hypothetical protein